MNESRLCNNCPYNFGQHTHGGAKCPTNDKPPKLMKYKTDELAWRAWDKWLAKAPGTDFSPKL